VASAQVKSAILLAGLNASGTTTVIEDTPTRDHSENMFRHFGLEVDVTDLENGAQAITIKGHQSLQPCAIDVPGDPSSAAFPAVAACITEGSEIVLPNIGINPRRTGIFACLQEMGASIEFKAKRVQAGEPVADIHIKHAPLKGITVSPALVPSMIDEFPVFAMAASCASGTTVMTGLEELRVKESDRLAMIAKGLEACGVKLEMGEASLTIHGTGTPPQGGAEIETALDHRIAMAFLVLGGVTAEAILIDDASPIKTSFPNFVELMNELGASIYADEY
jgi:3-phosphoshikimate 1-carboxyvinyltransferase